MITVEPAADGFERIDIAAASGLPLRGRISEGNYILRWVHENHLQEGWSRPYVEADPLPWYRRYRRPERWLINSGKWFIERRRS